MIGICKTLGYLKLKQTTQLKSLCYGDTGQGNDRNPRQLELWGANLSQYVNVNVTQQNIFVYVRVPSMCAVHKV